MSYYYYVILLSQFYIITIVKETASYCILLSHEFIFCASHFCLAAIFAVLKLLIDKTTTTMSETHIFQLHSCSCSVP